MRIPVHCNDCGRDFTASETFVGRRVACPGCGKSLRVKNSGAAMPGEADEERPRSGTIPRRARRGPPPQVVLSVVGIIAAVIVAGMALNNLPAIMQTVNALAGAPAAAPGDAGPNPVPQPPAVVQPEQQPEGPAASGYAPVPSNVPEVKPVREENKPPREKPKPPRRPRADRSQAVAEIDTDRGQRLFADLKEVVFVQHNGAGMNDPRKAISKRVAARSKVTLEKMGLEFSTDRPSPEAAVLKVTLSMKPFKKGTPGTQELSIDAELTCADQDDDHAPYALIWKKQDTLGTIAAKTLKKGRVPESMDDRLTSFFGSFRNTYSHALKTIKDAPLEESESDSEPAMDADADSDSDADSEDAEMESESESEAETETKAAE